MRWEPASLAVAACICGWLAVSACSGAARVQTCGEIADGGCPIGRGGSCDDVACLALYDCLGGDWTEVDTCPMNQGGGGAGGGGAGGGGGCESVSIDRTGERSSCAPDLQVPDCGVSAADACHPCDTGCEDFFLCFSDGWTAVAHCNQDGQVELDL
jgi:hypothetical protein